MVVVACNCRETKPTYYVYDIEVHKPTGAPGKHLYETRIKNYKLLSVGDTVYTRNAHNRYFYIIKAQIK